METGWSLPSGRRFPHCNSYPFCLHFESHKGQFNVKTLRDVGSYLYKGWMRFANLLAFVNTRVILTVLYVLLIGPISLILRLFGNDFLERDLTPSSSWWKVKEKREHTIENARHQF